MGKAGKWIKSLLNGGKKTKDKADKEKQNSRSNNPTTTDQIIENPTTPVAIPPTTPKDKKRWSFRRSSATAPGPKDSSSNESTPSKIGPPANVGSPNNEEKKPELIIAVGEAEAVTEDVSNESSDQDVVHSLPMDVQDAAAIKIQSVFRSYLARKALRALRGLVKLQALVRGHLVRRHTTTTLRCMQALITAQARARAQRIRSAEEAKMYNNHRPPAYRIIGEDYNFRNSYHEVEKGMMEENIKIVEMDHGESEARSNYSYYQNNERRDDRFSTHYASEFNNVKQEYQKISPAPSAITDMSPRTCSAHFGDYTFTTAQSSPHCAAYPIQEYAESLSYDYPLYPNYMANTQSSRAKARSQSAPKQRPDSFERQLSKRRPSVEGRNIPRAVRMQRSSSNVGATPHNYHYPWSIKLDKSTVSLLESECGSTCSVLTTTNYSRFDVPNDHAQGHRY